MTSIAVVTVIGIPGVAWHDEVGYAIAEEVRATEGAKWIVVNLDRPRDFPDSHAPNIVVTTPRRLSLEAARRTALHTIDAQWVTYVDDVLILPGSLRARLDVVDGDSWSAGAVVDIETGAVIPPNDQSVIHRIDDRVGNGSSGVVIPQAVIAA